MHGVAGNDRLEISSISDGGMRKDNPSGASPCCPMISRCVCISLFVSRLATACGLIPSPHNPTKTKHTSKYAHNKSTLSPLNLGTYASHWDRNPGSNTKHPYCTMPAFSIIFGPQRECHHQALLVNPLPPKQSRNTHPTMPDATISRRAIFPARPPSVYSLPPEHHLQIQTPSSIAIAFTKSQDLQQTLPTKSTCQTNCLPAL